MTILEMNIYNTLLAIEAEKGMAGIEPAHTLLIGDKLLERVQQRCSMPVTPNELVTALESLEIEGRIHLGNTIRDQYAQIIYR